MPEESKPERADEETPAPETAPEAVKDDPRASIYEKYDAIKAAREEAEAAPAKEEPETAPPEKASAPKENPKAEPAKEPEVVELTPEEFTERFKNVKVKGKFAGEEAVVDAKDLLRVQGLDRHLTKRLQEVARKEEALGAAGTQPPVEYRTTGAQPADKPLRYLGENEVAQKYDELFSESPYKATQFLNTVQAERQKAQAENEKVRMDTSEKDFMALHSDLDPGDYEAMKSSFSDPEFFRMNPDVDAAFARKDYYGALELVYTKVERQKLAKERAEIKAARDAALAEEQKIIELKKKGSVIRTASKPEAKPKADWKPPTNKEVIAEMAANRRGAMNI